MHRTLIVLLLLAAACAGRKPSVSGVSRALDPVDAIEMALKSYIESARDVYLVVDRKALISVGNMDSLAIARLSRRQHSSIAVGTTEDGRDCPADGRRCLGFVLRSYIEKAPILQLEVVSRLIPSVSPCAEQVVYLYYFRQVGRDLKLELDGFERSSFGQGCQQRDY